MKKSKKYIQANKNVDKEKLYSFSEAISLARSTAYAKFDETVDLAFNLGIDPRHADQMVRGSVALPAGTGKKIRICVITSGEHVKKAEEEGADFVGGDELIQKISSGWMEFDRVIASPDMMGKLGKVARILGPRGLMPNPKLGTVTTDIVKAVAEQKAGKVEYRCEKNGIVHVLIGKKSFSDDQLKQNFASIMAAIVKAKPASSKGIYVKGISLSTTMGPGIKLDPNEALTIAG